jgi:hypothetical protein
MTASDSGHGATLLMPFEAYGVRLLVSTDSQEVYERLPAMLPPGAVACPAERVVHSLAVNVRDDGTFDLGVDDGPFLVGLKLEIVLEVLESQLCAHVALEALGRVFVHAGVVGLGESAIVMPGRSFAGKTTLVAEFVRAGAAYYSDEYAVLDEQGLVHPYPRPLALREDGNPQIGHPVAALGGIAGDDPLPIGMILVSVYRAGGEWRPSTLSLGQGVLAMLANTVPARAKPAEALRSITRSVDGATVLEGERGEASSVVEQLLAQVSA